MQMPRCLVAAKKNKEIQVPACSAYASGEGALVKRDFSFERKGKACIMPPFIQKGFFVSNLAQRTDENAPK